MAHSSALPRCYPLLALTEAWNLPGCVLPQKPVLIGQVLRSTSVIEPVSMGLISHPMDRLASRNCQNR